MKIKTASKQQISLVYYRLNLIREMLTTKESAVAIYNSKP